MEHHAGAFQAVLDTRHNCFPGYPSNLTGYAVENAGVILRGQLLVMQELTWLLCGVFHYRKKKQEKGK